MITVKRPVFFITAVFLIAMAAAQGPLGAQVFRNPGIPRSEYFEITDFISRETGYVTAKASITLKSRNGRQYYHVVVREGNLFLNDIEVNHDDLTTISEKRFDARTGALLEAFSIDGTRAYLYNRDKKIDKYFQAKDRNIYSRYAYFISFRGFPFPSGGPVEFRSYMFEYGDAMPFRLSRVSRTTITVPSGTYDCHRLELAVTGLLSIFVKGKFIFYFEAAPPYRFVRYEEMDDDGRWSVNELVTPKK